jgi:hypothetical protein
MSRFDTGTLIWKQRASSRGRDSDAFLAAGSP